MLKNLLIITSLFIASCLSFNASSATDTAYIAVSGKATMTISPNRAELTLSADHNADRADQAQKQVQRVIEKSLAFLSTQGINKADIRSTTLSIQPQYVWDRDQQQQRLAGYRASQSIVVTLQNINLLQSTIDGGLTAGVTRLSPPRLFHSKQNALERQVLAMAVKDSRANAEAAAEALQVKVGQPLAIEAQSNNAVPHPEFRAAAMMSSDGGAPADTQLTGQIEITMQVTARFALTP
ncbi:MAG: SIMPL domain-containing protein [Halieaceae bacterium]|nr:SIMPL domain-containing protein [Halieaceae bacterium]